MKPSLNWYSEFTKYLCPAGDGVFTVSSGKSYREALQNLLYGSDENKKRDVWQEQLKKIPELNIPLLLGIPSDTGGGIQRGANWGPLFVRQALYERVKPKAVLDLGDVRVIPQLLLDEYLNEDIRRKCREALYLDPDTERAVSPLSITRRVAQLIYENFPTKKIFALGGDHSISYPLVKEFCALKKRQGINAGLLHFDAHTDLLKQRLGVDVTFGSWVYHVLSDFASPNHVIQVGVRATRFDRKYWEDNFGVQQYWSYEVKEEGALKIAEKILKSLLQKKVTELYVTVDIDSLDLKYASATGTPETEGLMPDDVIILIDTIANRIPVMAADLVEVAPFVRMDFHSHIDEPATTLKNAGLIAENLISHL